MWDVEPGLRPSVGLIFSASSVLVFGILHPSIAQFREHYFLFSVEPSSWDGVIMCPCLRIGWHFDEYGLREQRRTRMTSQIPSIQVIELWVMLTLSNAVGAYVNSTISSSLFCTSAEAIPTFLFRAVKRSEAPTKPHHCFERSAHTAPSVPTDVSRSLPLGHQPSRQGPPPASSRVDSHRSPQPQSAPRPSIPAPRPRARHTAAQQSDRCMGPRSPSCRYLPPLPPRERPLPPNQLADPLGQLPLPGPRLCFRRRLIRRHLPAKPARRLPR